LFVHLTKDFLKKLDAVEQRLAVSLDRDEIQTLGLKLRFYFNEVKHYQRLLNEVHNRVIEIQDKYGFMSEKSLSDRRPDEKAAAAEGKKEDIASLVGDWIARLEKQGVDPKELLRGAATAAAAEEQPAAHAETVKPPAQVKAATQEKEQAKISAPAVKAISPISAANIYKKNLPDTDADQEAAPLLDMVHEASELAFTEEPHVQPQTDIDKPASLEPEEIEHAEIPPSEKDITEEEIPLHEDSLELAAELEKEISEEPMDIPAPEETVQQADETEAVSAKLPEEDTAQEEIEQKETEIQNDVWADIRLWAERIRNETEPIDAIKLELESYANERSRDIVESLSKWSEEGVEQRIRPEDIVNAGFCAAYLLKSAGRTGTAVSILETVLRKNDGPAEPYRLLGDIYFSKGLFKPALDAYSKVKRIAGDESVERDVFIRCAKEAGEWDVVLMEIEKIQNSGDVELVLLKAEAMRAKGRHGEALRMIEKEIDASGSGAEKARLALFLAKALESKGDILGAIDSYEKCFEFEPNSAEAHFELGRLYFKHNAIPLAKNQLMTILKKYPESGWADKARDFMAKEGVL